MNLTLHQFRKEARYLLPRWSMWLLVLAVALAADAEWIAPIQGDRADPWWYGLLPMLVWTGAVWLAMSFPPEDACADDHSFAAVKPLPRLCFWAARCLTLGLMILVPLTLAEGLYLWASHRPGSDILTGMFERAFLTTAMLGWLLPLPALASGWRRYAVVGAAVLSGLVLQFAVIEVLNQAFRIYAELLFSGNNMTKAAYAGVVLMPALAWCQKCRHWPFHRTLAGVVAMVAACLALSCSPFLVPWSHQPRDPAWVAGIEARYGNSLTPELLAVKKDSTRQGELSLEADVTVPGVPSNLLACWQSQSSDFIQGTTSWKGTARTFPKRTYIAQLSFSGEMYPGTASRLSSNTRPNVLSAQRVGIWGFHTLNVGDFPTPARLDVPVEVTSRQDAHWLRYTVLGSQTLKKRTSIRSPWAEAEVLSVQADVDASNHPKPGAVTVTLKLGTRALESNGSPFPLWSQTPLMLYYPGKRLVWHRLSGGEIKASRAVQSGWVRGVYRMTWEEVLQPGTGVTKASLDSLELMMVHLEYLGTSHHTLAIHDLKLADHLGGSTGWPYLSAPAVTVAPREALQETLARLPRPGLDAPRDEIARFIARACVAAHSLKYRDDKNNDGTPRWPGDDRAAAEMLAPFILKHPDIITQLKVIGDLGGEHFVLEVLYATLRLAGIPIGAGTAADNTGLLARGDLSPSRWQAMAPAFVLALNQKSAEPLEALQARWKAEASAPISDQVLFNRLKKEDNYNLWSLLKGRPAAVPAARDIIRNRYSWEVQPSGPITYGNRMITIAAVAAGIPHALDYALRQTALIDLSELKAEDHAFLSHFSQVLGGKKLTWQELPSFVRSVMTWKAEHFSYDEQSFTWKRKAQL